MNKNISNAMRISTKLGEVIWHWNGHRNGGKEVKKRKWDRINEKEMLNIEHETSVWQETHETWRHNLCT